MNNPPEDERTSREDAFLADLYARAEEEIVPTHPDYDPDEGLERFLTQLSDSQPTIPGGRPILRSVAAPSGKLPAGVHGRGRLQSRRVGVIVPQGSEFDYIRESLPINGSEQVDGELYHHFQIPGVTGILRVLSDTGQAPAMLVAGRMISWLNVSLVVLLGVAASLDPDIGLGDVVVADRVQEYLRNARVDPGAEGGAFTFQRATESWRTNARLIDHVNNLGWLPDGETALAEWQRAAAARRPPWGGTRDSAHQEPSVHVGPLATGAPVVAARAFADWIRAGNRKLAALDMEAGGSTLAAYLNDSTDLLVVRGISDYANEPKSGLDATGDTDAWRRYAMRNAIEYLVLLLSSNGFPWSGTRGRASWSSDIRWALGGPAAGAVGAATAAHHDAQHDTAHDDQDVMAAHHDTPQHEHYDATHDVGFPDDQDAAHADYHGEP